MSRLSTALHNRLLRISIVCMALMLGISVFAFKPKNSQRLETVISPSTGFATYWRDATASMESRDFSKAIWSFLQYIQLGGDNPLVYYHLSELYLKTGQIDQALGSVQGYLQRVPHSADGFFQLGVIYNLLKDRAHAFEAYSKAVEIDPNYSEAYFNLGYLYEADNQFSQALEFYRKTVALNPKKAEAFYNLGNIYAQLDREEDAIIMYKKAIEQNQNYMDAYVNLSILLTKNGDFKEALMFLDEARLLGYDAPIEFVKTLELYREGAGKQL